MRPRARTRLGLAALGLAAFLGVTAVAVGANFTVYSNGFHNAADVRQIDKVRGGKRCTRTPANRGKRLRITASRGPANCVFRPPVVGDGPRPDHLFRVDGMILPGGAKAARNTAHLSLKIRAGGGTHYELRILPKGGRFRLRRRPAGNGFPVGGRDEAIARIGRLNRIRLVTRGDDVRATVNGTMIANLTDPNPGQVTGRWMHFGLGHQRQTRRSFSATVHRIAVSVPAP